ADGGGEVLVAGGDDDLGGGPGRGCPVGGGHGPGDEVQERVGSAPRGGSGVAGAVGAGAGFGQGGQGGVDGRGALGVQDQAVLGAAAGPGMEVRDRAARARSASWSRSAAVLTSRRVRVIAALSSRSVSPRQRTGSPCSSRWSRPVSSKTESRAPSGRVRLGRRRAGSCRPGRAPAPAPPRPPPRRRPPASRPPGRATARPTRPPRPRPGRGPGPARA